MIGCARSDIKLFRLNGTRIDTRTDTGYRKRYGRRCMHERSSATLGVRMAPVPSGRRRRLESLRLWIFARAPAAPSEIHLPLTGVDLSRGQNSLRQPLEGRGIAGGGRPGPHIQGDRHVRRGPWDERLEAPEECESARAVRTRDQSTGDSGVSEDPEGLGLETRYRVFCRHPLSRLAPDGILAEAWRLLRPRFGGRGASR